MYKHVSRSEWNNCQKDNRCAQILTVEHANMKRYWVKSFTFLKLSLEPDIVRPISPYLHTHTCVILKNSRTFCSSRRLRFDVKTFSWSEIAFKCFAKCAQLLTNSSFFSYSSRFPWVCSVFIDKQNVQLEGLWLRFACCH